MIKFLVGVLCGFILSGNAHAATWTDYVPALSSTRQAGMLVWDDTGQRTSEWIGFGNGSILWQDPNVGSGGSVEQWRLNDGFWKIMAFDSHPVVCLKAILTDLNSGVSQEIDCSGGGHPYVPLLIPADPWQIKIWGKVADVPFYWVSDFFTGNTKFNPRYYQGPTTLAVLTQREQWWDRNGGWMDGGNYPAMFDANGVPINTSWMFGVPMAREATLAKGLGVWTIHNFKTGRDVDLYSTWNW